MFNFEKLEVWQEAVRFAALVYRITDKFPPEERFGLTGQMRRASVSSSSNVAEGCSRSSAAAYAHFVEIAMGSTFEVVSEAALARLRGYMTDDDHQELYAAAVRLGKMLSGLRRSLVGEM